MRTKGTASEWPSSAKRWKRMDSACGFFGLFRFLRLFSRFGVLRLLLLQIIAPGFPYPEAKSLSSITFFGFVIK